jgi:hypothetical protein
MPRSGTSLVTQLLHRCGVDLGAPGDLMSASADNPDGYWENLKFLRLNDRLLAASGGTWFAPPATLAPTPRITADAKALVAAFDGHEPWAWKDPRNTVTLPFWQSLLPSMRVIVCVRHPDETAASLVAGRMVPRTWRLYWTVTRPGSPIRLRRGAARFPERCWTMARGSVSAARRRRLVTEVGLELWRVYYTRLLEHTSATRCLVTHYEAMLKDPRAELARILAFAGVGASAAVRDEAIRIVSPRLRHHHHARAAVLDPALDSIYAHLVREAAHVPDPE